MATVNGMTAEAMAAIRNAVVEGAAVNGSGHLILTKHDGTTTDAGSVIGPIGVPGVSQAQLDTFMSDHLPVNSIIEYNGITPPSAKWLAMIGQTVTNAQTLYPDWWAVLPAAMKSGANAIMPDTRGKVSVGYNSADTDFDTIGETGGAKTHTLTQAELPAVSVTVDPPATNVTINPPATAVTGATGTQDRNHRHYPNSHNYFVVQDAVASGGGVAVSPGARQVTETSTTTTEVGAFGEDGGPHAHGAGSLAVDIAPFNVSVDIGQFNSGNMGSGAAHSIVQPYVTFLKMIKVAK